MNVVKCNVLDAAKLIVMTSNYNEIFIPISETNRSKHIESLEEKFKVGTKFTPEHFKSQVIYRMGGVSNPIRFIDTTIVDFSYYMGCWIKVTANYSEWINDEGFESKLEKWEHFREHYNAMTGELQEEPLHKDKECKIYTF